MLKIYCKSPQQLLNNMLPMLTNIPHQHPEPHRSTSITEGIMKDVEQANETQTITFMESWRAMMLGGGCSEGCRPWRAGSRRACCCWERETKRGRRSSVRGRSPAMTSTPAEAWTEGGEIRYAPWRSRKGRQRRSCRKEVGRTGDGHGGPPVDANFLRLCHGERERLRGGGRAA
jgi:hypothetical protein